MLFYIDFVLANSADPYEIPHYATFHLGFYCLPNYPLGASIYKGFKIIYSKTCLMQPLIKNKTKVLMENGSLMKGENIAECSPWSILQYF